MKKIYIFLILLCCNNALAQNQQTEMLVDEIKRLTGEIEMLKYDMRVIKQQIERQKIQVSTQEQNYINQKPLSDKSELNKDQYLESNSVIISENATEKQKYDLALAELKDKKYDLAKEQFADLINTYPNSTMLDRMFFWYGESFFYKKDFHSSALHYLRCYKKNPKGPKAPDALLKLASSLASLGQNEEACQFIFKLENEFHQRSSSIKKSANDLKLKYNCK